MSNQPSFYYEVVSQYKRTHSQVIDVVGRTSETANCVADACLSTIWRPREAFAWTLLRQAWAASPPIAPTATESAATEIEAICKLFETHLLYRTPDKDRWEAQGRACFSGKVAYFVERKLPVLFCLPAFPCKSSNPDKTASVKPDGGEHEALSTLHSFCAKLRVLYHPGCVVDLVSDGHVFSDCIGVDDILVTKYTEGLNQVVQALTSETNATNVLQTRGKLIQLHSLSTLLSGKADWKALLSNSPAVHRPIQTMTTKVDEKYRAILLATCSSSARDVRYITKKNPAHPLTALYAGFSRFMCEDLKANPDMKISTSSHRRRIASDVALEMILRNQAYSHLTELVMPRHVRLSIHAHDNSGPKFAVSLLPPDRFQVLGNANELTAMLQDGRSLEDHTAVAAGNHLHIPTPWHSVLVEVEGAPKTFVCKAGMIMEELRRGDSPWTSESGYVSDHSKGGRFVLKLQRNKRF